MCGHLDTRRIEAKDHGAETIRPECGNAVSCKIAQHAKSKEWA